MKYKRLQDADNEARFMSGSWGVCYVYDFGSHYEISISDLSSFKQYKMVSVFQNGKRTK